MDEAKVRQAIEEHIPVLNRDTHVLILDGRTFSMNEVGEAIRAHDRLQREHEKVGELVEAAQWAVDVLRSFLTDGLPDSDGSVQMYLEETERSQQTIAAVKEVRGE